MDGKIIEKEKNNFLSKDNLKNLLYFLLILNYIKNLLSNLENILN